MNKEELEEFLKAKGARFELIYTRQPILSVAQAQEYFPIQSLSLSLVLKADKGFFALLPLAERGRVDFKMLKKLLGCKDVNLATEKQVIAQTGYEIGNVPLVGHGLPVIFDKKLLLHDYIYGGSGDKNYTLKINPQDLKMLSHVFMEFA